MKHHLCIVVFFSMLLVSVSNSFAQTPEPISAAFENMPAKDMDESMPSADEMSGMDMQMPSGEAQLQDEGDIAVVAAQATATIKGTAEGSPIKGEIAFSETKDGVIIDAEVFDVPNPGLHGFHVHEKGSCNEEGKAAGGHYNPDNVEHGDLMLSGHMKAHAGDMGNITIDENGHGTYTALLPGLTLTGEKFNISGLAVILHEKADDFGQPTGNAGGRIGCGVIIKQ